MNILIINGVNLNMLAYREAGIYGDFSYEELTQMIRIYAEKKGILAKLDFFVSNYEGEIVECIHKAIIEQTTAIIINPAAFSHYSYAIHDALLMFKGIKVEVHLSDVHNRDVFRKNLVTANASDHMISGLQEKSYFEALDYIMTKQATVK
ncbi:3-dehydroquinate dehydratase [Erysipelotrichaceae bacterium]|nr:3-dehydroquinate dehydratase [Erysipelotrichaceae bacterium]